ncbi:MAG: OmpA family protein [Rubricoccaceae bacterium]|nr:OmpA family protein [Rubricoccaceae bacterium]
MPQSTLLALSLSLLVACGVDPSTSDQPQAPDSTTATSPASETSSEANQSLEQESDLLTLANGATLVSASANENRALDLINGNLEDRAWTSTGRNGETGPFTFVFELLAPTRLTQAGVDNAADQPSGGDTVARTFEIEASSTSSESGFISLGSITVGEAEAAFVDVTSTEPFRWLRYTLINSHDPEAPFVYFDEVIAYGEQESVPSDDGRFNDIFQTAGSSYVEMHQAGTMISGCYTQTGGRGGGTLSGNVDNGVARISWKDYANDVQGTALFVINSAGELKGVRYRLPGRQPWNGPAASDDVTTPCSQVEQPENPISAALEESGEITLYGIYFDFDMDTLKPESEPVLQQLREALEESPNLRIVIEGHTDSMGEDAYNLDLSQRRAAAVVAWLTENGIESNRLSPEGKGETEPVADNGTADGRALNRRVDIIRQ